FFRLETVSRYQLAIGDNALPFTEQVGKNAVVIHGKGTLAIGNCKADIEGLVVTLDGARHHQAADAHIGTHWCITIDHLVRRIEQVDVLFQGKQQQSDCRTERDQYSEDNQQTLFSDRIHSVPLSSAWRRARRFTSSRALRCATTANRMFRPISSAEI